mgnify:CR=1 FL=1
MRKRYRPTLLLVEDNPDDADLAKRALKSEGIDVEIVVAEDGQKALSYLFGKGAYAGRDVNDVPGLVVLDLKMPKVSGLEVLEKIRNVPRTRFIPVVILSSSDEQQDLIDSYKLNANSYIRKPVDFVEFNETMALVCKYWLEKNEVPAMTTEAQT